MRYLKDLSLSERIYRLSGTVVLVFLLVIGWLFLEYRSSLYEARRQEVKSLVESAWQILDFHAQQAATGHLATDEAQHRALQIVGKQRFDQGNYFWVTDLTPKMVMHPMFPDQPGGVAGFWGPAEDAFLQEMTRVLQADSAGFVQYHWPRPGSSEPVAKLSFAKVVPEWGWVIGAGFYLDDIDRLLARKALLMAALLAAVVVAALILVSYVARTITVPMGEAVAMIEALEGGDLSHRLQLTQADEVGRLAKAMDAFADNLQYEVLTAFQRLAEGDFTFEAKGLIREPLTKANRKLNALVMQLQAAVGRERAEKAKSEAILAGIGDGIAILDREGRIAFQNPIHRALMGEHLGESCRQAYQHCLGECERCAVTLSWEDGRIHQVERYLGASEGGGRWLETTTSPVK
ncbi:MAG: cache domain-containing protein, partial [Desulfuromonadales bacterium]|nr:cache domain-containing protein [Desulfuromonadales bacterium]